MQHLIVYFVPENKKLKMNQWHTMATDSLSAIELFKSINVDFKCKIMGVGRYREDSPINSYFI
jgi:hypothetical protein